MASDAPNGMELDEGSSPATPSRWATTPAAGCVTTGTGRSAAAKDRAPEQGHWGT